MHCPKCDAPDYFPAHPCPDCEFSADPDLTTELEAEQTITWYLERWPQIPFAHPKIEITPGYLTAAGDVTFAGIQVHVRGRGKITLRAGLPEIQILDLSIPLPAPLRRSLENELGSQIRRAGELPVRFTSADWGDGLVTVTGTIR